MLNFVMKDQYCINLREPLTNRCLVLVIFSYLRQGRRTAIYEDIWTHEN